MKNLAILALAALIAVPANAAGVTISGYIDIGYISAQNPNLISAAVAGGGRMQASGATNGNWSGTPGFALNEVNLDLASQLTNDISAFMSFDATAANVRPAIDYAYVDFANPGPFDLNVRVGRIPSVVGIEQRVSESNQTKFINLSLLSPFMVGALDGAAIYGSFSPVNYALAISNGDIISGSPAAITSSINAITANGVGGANTAAITPGNNGGTALGASNNNNNDLALSGRLGVVPIEGLEIGVSGSYDKYVTAPSGQKNLNRNMIAVDASYVWGALTLRGEYATFQEKVNQTPNPDHRLNGYYIEGIYDLNSKISLQARYSGAQLNNSLSTAGNARVLDYYTINLGGSYRIADNVMLKAEYDINAEKSINRNVIPNAACPNKDANNVCALSLVGSF